MSKERINLTDSVADVVVKMSDGNFGAIALMTQILKEGEAIDPDSMGAIFQILLFDSFGIYGTDMYVLHSDICGKQLNKTLAVVRAVQLGYFDKSVLKDACSRQDYSGRALVPVEDLYEKVKSRLPNFDKNEVEA